MHLLLHRKLSGMSTDVFSLSLNLLNWNMDWLIGISYHKWFHPNSVWSVYSPAVSIHVCTVSRAETRGDTTASHDPTMYFSKNCHSNVFEHMGVPGLSLRYSEEGMCIDQQVDWLPWWVLHDLYPTLNFVIHMINPSAAIKYGVQ